MDFTPKNINRFLFFKLPSAFLCGVRANYIDEQKCITTVLHRWLNQNPFNSMYFAVQAMAAELSTGALVMNHIKASGTKISMLVASNRQNHFHMQRWWIDKNNNSTSNCNRCRANLLDEISGNKRQKWNCFDDGIWVDCQIKISILRPFYYR